MKPSDIFILVGLEESQAITLAFRDLGVQAFSCDLKSCSGGHPEYHFKGDVFEAIKGGWLTTESGNRIYIPKWNGAIFHPVCFSGETLITTDKGLVPISEIKIGDKVLTHRGRWRKVTDTMASYSDKTRLITSSNSLHTVTTDDHPFYTRLRRNRKDEPEAFVSAKDLTTAHHTGFVLVPENEQSTEHSDGMLWLMGRYIADGFLRQSRHNPKWYESMSIAVGKHKEEYFLKSTKEFKFERSEKRTAIIFTIYNHVFLEHFRQFKRGAENKEIPSWVLALPKEKAKIFLDGYLSGDGHETDKKILASTVSKKLAIGLANLFLKVYEKPPSIFNATYRPIQFIEGRKVNVKQCYGVSITKKPSKKCNYIDGRYSWGRVLKNVSQQQTIAVYNISVDEDESYIANNNIVHNCTYLSVTANKWLKDQPARASGALVGAERRLAREESIWFFMQLANCNIDNVTLENPVGCMSSVYRKPDQIIQPMQFGHPEPKKTCLWTKGFPNLIPTHTGIEPEYHVTESGKRVPKWFFYADKSKGQAHRAELRSRTFSGVASALATQYTEFLLSGETKYTWENRNKKQCALF